MTAAVAPSVHVRPAARTTGPSLPAQVWLEARKSVSTRSGRALVAAAVLLAPAVMAVVGAASTEPLDDVVGPIVVTGMLSALVVLALGVLSTAGEWTHGTVQTTFLLEPRRSRVLVAKSVAVALMGAVSTAVAACLASLVLVGIEPSASWDGGARAIAMVAVAGAVFALVGAGVGAALGNTPGALTGVCLLNLGVLPLLQAFQPTLAENTDAGNAVLSLAQGDHTARSITILAVWVGVSIAAGAILTRRRAVQ